MTGMKKLSRLVGFIKYKDVSYPFEFNEEDFELNLYPKTEEDRLQNIDPEEIFKEHNSNTWIQRIKIEGTTAEGYYIVFSVLDNPSNYNGFISFNVNWYVCLNEKNNLNTINGFAVTGKEIDYFFPPSRDLTPHYDNSSMSVTHRRNGSMSCGRYKTAENINVSIDVCTYATIYFDTGEKPIVASSQMIITFMDLISIEALIKAFNNLRLFIKYVTYRQNADLLSANIFYTEPDGQKRDVGILVFPKKHEEEKDKKVNRHVIGYDILGEKTAELMEIIDSQIIGIEHICEKVEDWKSYPASRFILILAAFEREYRNIYGQNSNRSEDYEVVKKEIIGLVEDYRKDKSGSHKKYAAEIKRFIEKKEIGFAENVKHALEDNEKVMRFFVSYDYRDNYEIVIKDISKRVGELRNSLAHNKLYFKFCPQHLKDIRVIEELIYAMRLKNLPVDEDKIKKAIANLFKKGFIL